MGNYFAALCVLCHKTALEEENKEVRFVLRVMARVLKALARKDGIGVSQGRRNRRLTTASGIPAKRHSKEMAGW